MVEVAEHGFVCDWLRSHGKDHDPRMAPAPFQQVREVVRGSRRIGSVRICGSSDQRVNVVKHQNCA